jgi:hypothetical protein
MKKVRYAAGVVGALGMIPALAFTAPGATAAVRAPASTGKTVSLIHTTTTTTAAASSSSSSPGASVSAGAANPPCNHRKAHASKSSPPFGILKATIHYSRDIGCIGQVHGVLLSQDITGLWMRVRSYVNGHALPQRFNSHGSIHRSNHSISWTSYPHTTGVTKVCEAIVFASSPKKPVTGPVCENTGF